MLELLDQPATILLSLIFVRVSLLLGIAWIAHFCLRRMNPRGQIALWRCTYLGLFGVLAFSVWLPGWGPRLWITSAQIRDFLPAVMTQSDSYTSSAIAQPAIEDQSKDALPSDSPVANSVMTNANDIGIGPIEKSRSAQNQVRTSLTRLIHDVAVNLVRIYFVVVALLLLRLLTQHLRLRMQFRRADPAGIKVIESVARVAAELGLRRVPGVVVSKHTSVPLATGVLNPVIVMPPTVPAAHVSRELDFVLRHECSHFRGRDLDWSFFARVIQIVLWLHPLSWRMVAVHRYACDVRCDWIAGGEDPKRYSSMLAEMAVLLHHQASTPAAMAFLKRSDVARRVKRIESGVDGSPLSNRARTLAFASVFVALLLIGTFGQNGPAVFSNGTTDKVAVKVVDQNGNAVVGAVIKVQGLRARKESASAYGCPELPESTTNGQGIANVEYPRYVYEAMETGQIILAVNHPNHPNYFSQGESLDKPIEIVLASGRQVEVTAVDSSSGKRISEDLYCLLPKFDDGALQMNQEGVLATTALDPTCESLLLVTIRDGKPDLFSDLVDLRPSSTDALRIDNVAMSAGSRIEGQLSESVPRPVSGGYVGLMVAECVNENSIYDNTILWQDFAEIDADGTFVFPSVPRNADIQLAAVCDQWVSTSLPADEILKRFNYVDTMQHAKQMHNSIVVSQVFAPEALQPLVVEMEPEAVCRIQLTTESGAAVTDATISMSPNNAWHPGPGGIVGLYVKTAGILLGQREKDIAQFYRDHPGRFSTTNKRYFGKTDVDGKVTIQGLPGKQSIHLGVEHERYELPLTPRDSYHRTFPVDLTPGNTTEVNLIVVPIGQNVIGR